jgi:RNA polymerase sigma factor (sigma-70 family)
VEDVAQDVLLRLTEALRAGRFRGDSSFESYVRRATSYRCIDACRRGNRWRMVDLGDLAPTTDEPSPFDRARHRERLASFARVLAELPEHCRDLWTLVLEGASYDEMGERIGVRPGTLRVRLLRCRRRAEELLRETSPAAATRAGEATA